MHPFREFIREYEWVHLGIGIFGNLCFFVGSIFFLFEPLKTYGTWLFIIGAFGMLVGAVGSGSVKLERKRKDWGG
ncbi:MAG: YrhK family protein [Desulfovibrionales bacterium]